MESSDVVLPTPEDNFQNSLSIQLYTDGINRHYLETTKILIMTSLIMNLLTSEHSSAASPVIQLASFFIACNKLGHL